MYLELLGQLPSAFSSFLFTRAQIYKLSLGRRGFQQKLDLNSRYDT